MTLFVVGLLLFLGVHCVSIVARPWRDAQVQRLGEGPWKGLYSVVALAGFVLMLYGYGLARSAPVVLWTPPAFMRHVTALVMLPFFVLLLAAYVPGRIRTAARHPMLLAVKLWAAAHLLSNGTLADVLLFGAFLAWAVIDRIALKRRGAGAVPTAGRARAANDVVIVVLGLVLYVVFVGWGHRWLIGVSPMG